MESPCVIDSTKFVTPQSSGFKSYLKYMNRSEAVRAEKYSDAISIVFRAYGKLAIQLAITYSIRKNASKKEDNLYSFLSSKSVKETLHKMPF